MEKVFNRFIYSASEIRESWQIVEFFEQEFLRLEEEAKHHEERLKERQERLDKLEEGIRLTEERLKLAKLEGEALGEHNDFLRLEGKKLSEALQNLENNLEKKQAIATKDDHDSVQQFRDSLPIKPLEKVEIKLKKQGVIVKADPATDVYSSELKELYLASIKEIMMLRGKCGS